MQRRIVNRALQVIPPVAAFLGVTRSLEITAWANHHETTLLLTLFALVGSLLHHQLRHVVITSLCYGVSFLAARDIFFTMGLPDGLHNGIFPVLRMVSLATIALLTFCAALGESFCQGAVWPRRCYFGGAALYFFGTGFVSYAHSHSWQAVMMVITGCAATGAAIYADRIVATETEEELDDEPEEDEGEELERQHQLHLQKLRTKEWVDPANSI